VLVGSLYGAFYIFISAYFDEDKNPSNDTTNQDKNDSDDTTNEDKNCQDFGWARTFQTAYLALLFIFILMSITKPITRSGRIYSVFVFIFGIFIFISIAVGINFFWKNSENVYIAVMLIVTLVGSYILPPIFNFNRMSLCKYFVGVIILIFLTPTYINIIIIYSMANLHDVSWGNRATDENKGEQTKRALEQFRSLYLIVWVGVNAVYGYSVIYMTDKSQTIFILTLTVIVSSQVLIKLVAAVIYFFYEKYTKVAVGIKKKKENNNKRNIVITDRLRDVQREQRKDINKKILAWDNEESVRSPKTGGS
jgi:hypothetical protein